MRVAILCLLSTVSARAQGLGIVGGEAEGTLCEDGYAGQSVRGARFELPCSAERRNSSRRTALGEVTTESFMSRPGDARRLEVRVDTLPAAMLRHPPATLFDATWRGGYGFGAGARPVPGEPLPGEPITLTARGKSHPGRRYRLSFGGIRTSSVYYLVGNRLFGFHYLRPDADADEAPLDRLVRSFSLSRP